MITRLVKNEDLFFSRLPKDLLNFLFKDLDLQDALSMQGLGVENLNRVLREIWHERAKRHFPHHIKPDSYAQKNWLDFFNFYSLCDYQGMTDQGRQLFFLAKEERDHELMLAITSYSQLLGSDTKHDTLVKIARRMNKQSLLDYYYQIIYAHYSQVTGDMFNTVLNHTTIFEWAIYCRQDNATLTALAASGADIDRVTNREFSNLTRAAQTGNLIALNFLIKHHAYADHVNVSRIISVAISAAIESYHPECITPLINYAFANHIDWKPGTCLCKAAEMGFIDILELLHLNRAHIDAVNEYGETALHYAASHKHPHVIQWLLDHHAFAHTQSHAQHRKGATPIIYAVFAGDAATVEKFLDIGISVNSCDLDGQSLLHIAAQNNHLDVLKLLLDRGAAVDRNFGGTTTPLHTAVRMGYEAICHELIINHANVEAVNRNGETPLSIAKEKGNHNIIKMIYRHHPHLALKSVPANSASRGAAENEIKAYDIQKMHDESAVDLSTSTTKAHSLFARSHRKPNNNNNHANKIFHHKK